MKQKKAAFATLTATIILVTTTIYKKTLKTIDEAIRTIAQTK